MTKKQLLHTYLDVTKNLNYLQQEELEEWMKIEQWGILAEKEHRLNDKIRRLKKKR